MGIVSPHAYLLPTYTYDLSPFLGFLNFAGIATDINSHSIRIEAVGVTNESWQVSSSLLLWRSSTLKVSGDPPVINFSGSAAARATSSCEKISDKPVTVEGSCTVALKGRNVSAAANLMVERVGLDASSFFEVSGYVNRIVYNNTNGAEVFASTTAGKASWSLTLAPAGTNSNLKHNSAARNAVRRRRAVNPAATVAAASVSYNWLLGGGLMTGSVFELSSNATVGPFHMAALDALVAATAAGQPTAYTSSGGSQKHYLRAKVPDASDYTPEFGLCPTPPRFTRSCWL
jgi:hypothetical protein